MRTATLGSMATLAATTFAIGTMNVINSCDFPVYYNNTPADFRGLQYEAGTMEPGGGYSQTYTAIPNGETGGWSIKLSRVEGVFNQSIMQLEYNVETSTNKLWYDLSNVDGHPFGFNWDFSGEGDCLPTQTAYQCSTDDANGMQGGCNPENSVTVNLCEGGIGEPPAPGEDIGTGPAECSTMASSTTAYGGASPSTTAYTQPGATTDLYTDAGATTINTNPVYTQPSDASTIVYQPTTQYTNPVQPTDAASVVAVADDDNNSGIVTEVPITTTTTTSSDPYVAATDPVVTVQTVATEQEPGAWGPRGWGRHNTRRDAGAAPAPTTLALVARSPVADATALESETETERIAKRHAPVHRNPHQRPAGYGA